MFAVGNCRITGMAPLRVVKIRNVPVKVPFPFCRDAVCGCVVVLCSKIGGAEVVRPVP